MSEASDDSWRENFKIQEVTLAGITKERDELRAKCERFKAALDEIANEDIFDERLGDFVPTDAACIASDALSETKE